MLHSSGAGTTTEIIRQRRMYARLFSWSLAFLGSFWPSFRPREPAGPRRALASPAPGDIRWRMNEAIRPGQGTSSQTAAIPQLSVVVPTFNERDNVTPLFRKLEAARAGI